MRNKLKGGIETIIAVIILVGLVVALIISTVIPMAKETKDIGTAGVTKMSGLRSTLGN